MSCILGLIPECLYLTLFLIYTKNIKNKRLILFLLICISYVFLILFNNYKIFSYTFFIFFVYISLKLIYKNKAQIIDIFIINISLIYLTLIGFICSKFVINDYTIYWIMYAINRILMFIPFIFHKKMNKMLAYHMNI